MFSVFFFYLLKTIAPQRNVLNNMVYKHFSQFSTGSTTTIGALIALLTFNRL